MGNVDGDRVENILIKHLQNVLGKKGKQTFDKHILKSWSTENTEPETVK